MNRGSAAAVVMVVDQVEGAGRTVVVVAVVEGSAGKWVVAGTVVVAVLVLGPQTCVSRFGEVAAAPVYRVAVVEGSTQAAAAAGVAAADRPNSWGEGSASSDGKGRC